MPDPFLLKLLAVTTAVVSLGPRLAAGDEDAAATVDQLAAVLSSASPSDQR
jgi:hypothetical protein